MLFPITSNISEAAKQIHLSQPTVSHQIKLLEQELGVTLFIRSSTGLKLTDAGRLMLPGRAASCTIPTISKI
jgi:DNA-binding transcriptional LysR family regulator